MVFRKIRLQILNKIAQARASYAFYDFIQAFLLGFPENPFPL
jgi:hypothetical protein